jgi:hypothetical protein
MKLLDPENRGQLAARKSGCCCCFARPRRSRNQGCQMAYISDQNPNLGKFWRSSEWERLVGMAIWNLLRPFDIFCDHLVKVQFWYIFPRFGIWFQEKSGSPARQHTNFSITKTTKENFIFGGQLIGQSILVP